MPRYAKFILVFVALLMIAPVQAQSQATHPPQLLYVSGKLLYLLDAMTGISTVLPGIDVVYPSTWAWSPDGQDILGLSHSREGDTLRVYDIDHSDFLKNIDVHAPAFKLHSAAWSPDSMTISYSINVSLKTGQLWLLDLATGEQTSIYQSPQVHGRETGVYDQWWSPSGDRLLFEGFSEIMGGTDDNLTLINVLTGKTIELYDRFFAFYDPHWSPDGKWILLILYDNYSGQPSEAENYIDQGDVFLFNADDGKEYHITNTPQVLEDNLRWSADGQDIQFEVNHQRATAALQDILDHPSSELPLRIEPVPSTPPPLGNYESTSPDGRYILYFDAQYNFWVRDTSLNRTQKIDQDLVPSEIIGWRP